MIFTNPQNLRYIVLVGPSDAGFQQSLACSVAILNAQLKGAEALPTAPYVLPRPFLFGGSCLSFRSAHLDFSRCNDLRDSVIILNVARTTPLMERYASIIQLRPYTDDEFDEFAGELMRFSGGQDPFRTY